MPSFVPRDCRCTACASTCAALWRITARPSSVSAAPASTSTSSWGRQARSFSVPSGARTTTTACGPLPGRPAPRTASPAVVPAPTRTVTAGAGAMSEDTAVLLGRCGADAEGCAPRGPRLSTGTDTVPSRAPGLRTVLGPDVVHHGGPSHTGAGDPGPRDPVLERCPGAAFAGP